MSCPSCDAPVVADQRYCLSCGERVGERRLDPLALLRARRGAASVPPAAPELPEAEATRYGWNPRTLAASCLGLLLGGALMGAAFAPGPAGSLAASAGQIVLVTSPVAPATEPVAPPAATFAPSGPAVSSSPAPAAPAAAAPAPPAFVPEPVPEPLPPAPDDTPAPAPEKPSIGHVFLVVLPGAPEDPEAVFPEDLVAHGQLLTSYEPVGTSALSNRIALVSGQEPTPNTEADCPDYEQCLVAPETKTLADQLSTWGFEWRAYVEGMEEPCRRPDPLDPFVYFHSVVDLADCSQHVLPLDQFDAKAVFNLIAPASDDQLSTWIDPILKSKPYKKDGLLVILYDRAPDALVLSPFVEAGSTNDKPYDHYSLLKTIEDRIGLGEHLGHADDRKVHAFARDVFDRELDPLQEPEAQ
jgi:phosphatidylinositol-3-phosphatase